MHGVSGLIGSLKSCLKVSPIAVLATNSSMLTKLHSLVGELQSFLPRECRHDDAGLVDDISEALAAGSVTTSLSL